jgi:hypothetical protein
MKPMINQVFKDTNTGVHYRVLAHKSNSDDIITIKISNGIAMGMPYVEDITFFSRNHIRMMDFDPFKIDCLETELSDSEKKYRDERMDSIRSIIDDEKVFDPKWRNEQINLLSNSEKAGRKRTTTYDLLKKYWARGCDENALVPRFSLCGGPGVRKKMALVTNGKKNIVPKNWCPLSEELIEKIRRGYRKYYMYNPKNSLRQARIDFMAHVGLTASTGPTLRQFIYWGTELNDPIEIIKARKGEINYKQNLRPLTGTGRDHSYGPCSEVMIDNTIDNVHVVSSDRKYMGRFTIYFTVDIFSGLITGVYLTPEHPSYLTGCMCILNTSEDKVEFCREFGIDITEDIWPCHYLPGRILADRGEFLSNQASSLTKNLGIDISNTPSYRPDLKAYVETQMNVYQLKLKGLLFKSGLIDATDEPRVAADSRKQACLTLNDVLKLVLHEIIFYNKYHWMSDYPLSEEMKFENVNPTPNNIFNWGISKGLGRIRQLEKKVIWRNCLPRKSYSISRAGIYIKPYHFITRDKENGEVIEELRLSSSKCEVAYNTTDFNQTYLVYKKSFIPIVPKQNVSFQNYFEFENFVRDLSENKKLHSEYADNAEVEKRKEQIKIIDEAKKHKPKKVTVNNVRERRSKEIIQHRQKAIEKIDTELNWPIARSKTESSNLGGLPLLTEKLMNYKTKNL